jgi:hypothetical protein
LTVSGLVDFYYLWQFSNPNSHSNPQNSLGVPAYDSRYNTPSISLAELNLAMAPPSAGGFGFKATLETGDTADINHGGLGTNPSAFPEARYKNIQQLYVTWLGASGWGADLGEFYTPFGYEVTESNGNYNYSRSDIFQFLLPVYHTGVRIYTPSMKGLVATLYVVRAINNTAHEGVNTDHNDPGYIGNFIYADPKGKWSGAESFGYSNDRVAFTSMKDQVTLSDTDFTYNINPTNLIGLNYTYRKDNFPDANPGTHTTSNGYAAYYRNQFNKRNALALRYDKFDSSTPGLQSVHPWEATATLEDKPAGDFLTRLEYRHDANNINGSFLKGSNPNGSKEQDTLSISEVYTFP